MLDLGGRAVSAVCLSGVGGGIARTGATEAAICIPRSIPDGEKL